MTNASQPATKADLQTLKQSLEGRMEEKFQKLYDADDQILTVLTNIDKRLTQKVESHGHRITHLEELAGILS